MAIYYSNKSRGARTSFSPNNTRTRKIRDKYLLTTDQGSWIALEKKEYDDFINGRLDSNLFENLEKRGIIITQNNLKLITEDYRKRLNYLFRGNSLHILTTTKRCNLKCVYCHSAVASKIANEKEYDMDKKTAKKTLEFIFQTPEKVITIEFQGGETLLREDLFKYVVKEAKKINKKHNKNIRFALVSNLTLMTDELLNWIKKEKVDICTSLDGPKELHDKNRWFEGGKASYEEVTSQLKRLKEKGINHIGMLMVTTKYSIPLWKEIVDEYVKWGQQSLQLKYINKLGFADLAWKQIGYTMDEFLDFWEKSVDYMIELNKKGIKIQERFVVLILKKILTKFDPNFLDFRGPTCGAVAGQLAYDHKGDIFSCDEGRMNKEMFGLGTVKDSNYEKVLSSEKAQGIISASIIDNNIMCDKCAYKPWCGLCPVISYAEQGNILPKISNFSLHKLHEFQFDYVFEKLLFDKEARKVLFSWASNWK